MTPTQAQIEAAAMAMEQKMFAPHELPLDDELHTKYLDTATAALTAAEVGEWKATARNNAMQVLADRNASLIERVKKLAKDRSEIEAATIERCAQVMANYAGMNSNEARASAIRALKDKDMNQLSSDAEIEMIRRRLRSTEKDIESMRRCFIDEIERLRAEIESLKSKDRP